MASDFNRRETTAELSAKALKRLRKEFNLVSSEVWVDEAHRVDFVAYRIGSGYTNAAAERSTFCFVEVKSCMDDFTSGHGRTFEGDMEQGEWCLAEQEAELVEDAKKVLLEEMDDAIKRLKDKEGKEAADD